MINVKGKDLHELLLSHFVSNFSVSPSGSGFKVILPFNDFQGSPIEMFVEIEDDRIILDDLGHCAGVLFSMGQHIIDSPAHQLTRNLTEAYKIDMDYNLGLLKQKIDLKEIGQSINEFIKVLISIQTVVPELQRRKRVVSGRTRLSSLIGRDIQQLKLPVYVQRQVEVEGRHESWIIDYRYARKRDLKIEDVLIYAAELNVKEPRKHAEHTLALAFDILAMRDSRDLRIVYSLDGDGENPAARRAAMLIEDFQHLAGYTAYNYANMEQRSQLMASTIQDLTPLSRNKN